jgi:hypothetical protein
MTRGIGTGLSSVAVACAIVVVKSKSVSKVMANLSARDISAVAKQDWRLNSNTYL